MHINEFEALSEEQLAKIEKDKRTKQYKKLQYKLGFLPLLRRIQQLKRVLIDDIFLPFFFSSWKSYEIFKAIRTCFLMSFFFLF